MSIERGNGNMLTADVDALVNTDGSRFHGCFELFADTEEFVGDYVHRVCGEVLDDRAAASPARSEAALTVERVLHASVAETLDRLQVRR